ncbi:protein kinase family protein [Pseudoxanthomonas sp. PXM03]|uniref:ORC-CDC6 family AAA ATPase n=1 Tax=Pseudoxanthomonas sp. PXM03 TaxID=2769284 RepID=UPI00177E6F72|nr:protein kinase family protein [Pseudoxanthomonas sp. PXM03]MBD9435731.1 protein kinase family protein [Pseudoxanthomonas sp. PXM03]
MEPLNMKSRRIQMSDPTKAWLRDGGSFPAFLDITLANASKMQFEILDRLADGRVPGVAERMGHKGFTLRVRSSANNRVYAAKICLREDYSPDKLTEEMTIASEIDAVAPILSHEHVGIVDSLPAQPDPSTVWLCFIGRWIEGSTLERLIESGADKLQPELALLVLKKLLSAVLYLEKKGLKHDDLHLGNVMLSKRPQEIIDSEPGSDQYSIDIIDLGSIKRRDTPTRKLHDDWSCYVRCIVKIHNTLHGDRAIAARYPQLLKGLFEFSQLLSDDDPTRHFIDPASLVAHIDDAKRSMYMAPADVGGSALSSPFTAISAEHLASDRLLLQLFVDNLGWFSSVKDPTPSVLTGPRGCGKSMVFRYMSLRTHLATEETARTALSDLSFVGIYIGCASDLQNDLLWIKREPGRAEHLASQIVTFFNLIAARELFRTLSMIAATDSVGKALGVSQGTISRLAEFSVSSLGLPANHISATGMDSGQGLADELDRIRIKLARSMLEGSSPEVVLPDTFLRDLTRMAVRFMPGLQSRPIVFLLDDFTQQRLGEKVQSVLNPILWQRDSACVFKISCEPYGFSNSHIDDAKLDQNREYIVIDTGQQLLNSAPDIAAQRRRFVEGLIDKRLAAANYIGRVKDLIGESSHKKDTELAISIRDSVQGRSYHYNGLEVLSNAWSGDVATVLFMAREMFHRAGVTQERTALIPHQHQHEAIVYVSRALVERVEYCHPFGSEMRGVLDMFARLARRLLMEASLQTDIDSKLEVPQRRYRMEVDIDEEGALFDQLHRMTGSDHAGLLLKELVRRSIFIDLGESRSKARKRTIRLQVRSSLLPNYGTSLVRKNYLDVRSLHELSLLLNRDKAFVDRVWSRSADLSRAITGDLFTGADQP